MAIAAKTLRLALNAGASKHGRGGPAVAPNQSSTNSLRRRRDMLNLEAWEKAARCALRIAVLYAALLAVQSGRRWLWAFIAFHDYPLLLGTSLLAYSFGLSHAVDADHSPRSTT